MQSYNPQDAAAGISCLMELGHEQDARNEFGDRAVDAWLIAQGWNPDAERGFVAEYDESGMIVNGN